MEVVSINTDAVGLYVHIPFCTTKCHYCNFTSAPVAQHDPIRMVAALLKELTLYGSPEQITTLYIGGGSPTSLPPAQLQRLLSSLKDCGMEPREWTVECNPGQVSAATLEQMLAIGVNRLSFGVQSFHDSELQRLGRCHTAHQAQEAIRMAQTVGYRNIGLDLIFALPGSQPDTWQRSLDQALALDIPHIAAYSLSYEPGTPLADDLAAGRLQAVEEEMDAHQYQQVIDTLTSAGYQHYEISNFAHSGWACLHNLCYWQNRPFLGIGPAAASYWARQRTKNTDSLSDYLAAVESGQHPWVQARTPSSHDQLCETAVLNLRTSRGIDATTFSQDTGHDLWEVFGEVITLHQKNGWLQVDADRVCLTPAARPIADRILCDFASL